MGNRVGRAILALILAFIVLVLVLVVYQKTTFLLSHRERGVFTAQQVEERLVEGDRHTTCFGTLEVAGDRVPGRFQLDSCDHVGERVNVLRAGDQTMVDQDNAMTYVEAVGGIIFGVVTLWGLASVVRPRREQGAGVSA